MGIVHNSINRKYNGISGYRVAMYKVIDIVTNRKRKEDKQWKNKQ